MKYILDGKKMVSREEAHAYLKDTFGFPDYYGKNLDALHDCLTEQKDVEIEVQHEEEMLAALGKYGEKLMQVLDDVKNR
ncbi:MAG: barstar family protein [Anaerotignum sp.]|nr:barstar family protein [Anaerotignum sp.]MBP3629796.1 barstar family protein [Anaerotignum sp.]